LTVTVTVNEQPVTLPSHRDTGLEIKEEAIRQHVPIQLDFVLSEELPNHKTRIVGDDDIVEVNKRTQFLAIPNDDNS